MVVVIGEGDKAEMRPVDLGDNYGDSFLLNKGAFQPCRPPPITTTILPFCVWMTAVLRDQDGR